MREDIKAIPIMEAAGWKTTYSAQDKRHGRTNINESASIPHDPVGFEKDNQHVWVAYTGPFSEERGSSGWVCAELIGGYYCNHRAVTIEECSKLAS